MKPSPKRLTLNPPAVADAAQILTIAGDPRAIEYNPGDRVYSLDEAVDLVWRFRDHWAQQADPSVGVQVGTRRLTARARLASPAERDALWPLMVRTFPLYEQYAHKTDRQIPVVLLTAQD